MAFSFFRWLLRARDTPEPVTAEEFFDLLADCQVRDLALMSCSNLLGNVVSKCELQTFLNHEEVKGDEHYLWNVSPNQNQSAAAFWQKAVHRMCYDRAALVVENGGKVYVADSWNRQQYALREDVFSQVTVGDFTFSRSFTASEVLFFELSAESARQVIDGLYDSYSNLITCGMKGYRKSRGEKGTLELDTTVMGDEKAKDAYTDIKNKGFQRFAEADTAIMPLFRGMKYTQLGDKTYNSDTSRDIRAMIDDVTDFSARGFGIPACLLNGTVQNVDSATEQLLTFAVEPLLRGIQQELNRKRNGLEGWKKGNYCRFDTTRVKHIDILDAAGKIDKLIGCGAECVNDIRALLGQPLINEPWAWRHFLTKNYAGIDAGEGGKKA